MALIYQNARVTIAATGAIDCSVGCFMAQPSIPEPVRLLHTHDGVDMDIFVPGCR